MEKKEFIATTNEDLYNTFKQKYINLSEVAKYLGVGLEQARAFLYNTMFIKNGNEKKYYIVEVANALWALREHDTLSVRRSAS